LTTLVKFIVLGDSGTGKTCFVNRFIEGKFLKDPMHTIGVEFSSKMTQVFGNYVNIQIWDTAGQERFRSVATSYYRGATGCLLLYDVTNRASYENILKWLNDARRLAGPDLVVMLVGNKADDVGAESSREVTYLEASKLAQDNGMMMIEASAATGEFVSDAFLRTTKSVLLKLDEGVAPTSSERMSQDRSLQLRPAEPLNQKSTCKC